MNVAARRLLASLVLLSSLVPAAGMACAILPKEKDAERARQIVDAARATTLALREQADLIFVGRLSSLSVEQETVDGQTLQHHQALFKVDEEIKGHYPAGQALAYTVNKNRVWVSVGCSPQYWQFPKENGTGETYLVYAREGQILRTNHIPTDTQALSGHEEAALVRSLH
ncbi:MAG: hypothetical protein WCC39_03480 [Telluria sp.]